MKTKENGKEEEQAVSAAEMLYLYALWPCWTTTELLLFKELPAVLG